MGNDNLDSRAGIVKMTSRGYYTVYDNEGHKLCNHTGVT